MSNIRSWSSRLVEQTEAHVVVGLLLLLLLGGGGGLLGGSTTGGGTTSSGGGGATRGNGGKLLRAGRDQLESVLVLYCAMGGFAQFSHIQRCRTSLMSLPSSSLRRVERRSSSASMPTELRTPLMSSAEGEVLPPRLRRR